MRTNSIVCDICEKIHKSGTKENWKEIIFEYRNWFRNEKSENLELCSSCFSNWLKINSKDILNILNVEMILSIKPLNVETPKDIFTQTECSPQPN